MTNQYLKEHQAAMMASTKTMQESVELRKAVDDAKILAAAQLATSEAVRGDLASARREADEARLSLEASKASVQSSSSEAGQQLVARDATIAEIGAELGALKESGVAAEQQASTALAVKSAELMAARRELEALRAQLAAAATRLEEAVNEAAAAAPAAETAAAHAAAATATPAVDAGRVEELEAANKELAAQVTSAHEAGLAEGKLGTGKAVARKTKKIMKVLFAQLQGRLVEAHGEESAAPALEIAKDVIREVTTAALADVAR